MKTQEVPTDLREFYKVFEMLERKYQSAQVFSDWMGMVICAFAHKTMEEEYMKLSGRYTTDEMTEFAKLTAILIKTIDMKFCDYDEKSNPVWYDFFGDFYQLISSRSKAQGLGQFFTPEAVVTAMVLMQNIDGENKTVLDPACGSGRFLIASHAHNPRNIHFGADLDFVCCQMSVLNMMMHGCRGEIVWKNALDTESYYRGWLINNNGAPSILDLPKEKSLMYKIDNSYSEEAKKHIVQETKPLTKKQKFKEEQFSMFQ